MINLFGQSFMNMISHSSSFSAAFVTDLVSAGASNFWQAALDWIYRLVWSVVSLIMTIMDALEYVAFSFLGIDMGITDFSRVTKLINFNELTNTFRAISGLAILLMLIFTIVAMIRQEWSIASAGFSQNGKEASNPKIPFLTRILKNFVIIL